MTKMIEICPDILAIHQELGIPESYANSCGLDFQPDCQQLVATEKDIFDRQPFLEKETFNAWQAMQKSAREKRVELQIVSAYRSALYQKELLQKKLAAGQSLKEILKVNAAPGYSEHHSGCAIDITTPEFEPLEVEFEKSPAYAWLCEHAVEFGFTLSFPRDNAAGMLYEPWHWKYTGKLNPPA